MENLNRPVIKVWHKNLKRALDSIYKSHCPFCEDGLFLLHRDQITIKLATYDACISCGQMIEYVDIEDLRKEEALLEKSHEQTL